MRHNRQDFVQAGPFKPSLVFTGEVQKGPLLAACGGGLTALEGAGWLVYLAARWGVYAADRRSCTLGADGIPCASVFFWRVALGMSVAATVCGVLVTLGFVLRQTWARALALVASIGVLLIQVPIAAVAVGHHRDGLVGALLVVGLCLPAALLVTGLMTAYRRLPHHSTRAPSWRTTR